VTLEDQIREAVAAGSQVHVWPQHFADGYEATVRSRGGVNHSAHIHADPVVALIGALTSDERKRRDGLRVAAVERDPAQLNIEDAIAVAADDFDGLV